MKTNIRGHKTNVTENERDYILEKVTKLEKLFHNPEEVKVQVVVKEYDFKSRVEVVINAERYVIRADVKEQDAKAAIDVAIDKLERQIRKHKTRVNKKIKDRLPLGEALFVLEEIEEAYDELPINKRKSIELLAMDADEATLQLQLIDHDFYMFLDIESNKPAIVYERKDGGYGLLETE